jgi:dipeptidyl aminopeptidase/acylaminoacyl peptidase
MLLMQGALDDNVLPAIQEKFVQTYKAAGGDVQFQVFEGSEHEWVAKPGRRPTAPGRWSRPTSRAS